MTPRISWRDHLFGLSLATAYVVLLMATAGDIGMSRDESFYVIAAQDYAGWFDLLAEDPARAMEDGVRDRAWDFNHEHPGLVKSLFALSWLAHQKWELFSTDSMAFRFPGMLSAGLLLWLIYIFGARIFGRQAGAFAAAAFALMPRIFYHSHLNCFDIPIVLATTFTVYAYWRSLTCRTWAVWTGIAWGLALATKHNSWVLPGIFMIHFVWMSRSVAAARKRGEITPRRLSVRPWWLIAMVLLGPPIFIATWPWLWSDELLARFGWYARFHVSHVYYDIAYFGVSHFEPPFPVSYPFVLTLFTVPLTVLVLCVLGIRERLRAILPEWLNARVWKNGSVQADAARTDVLLMGALLAPLVIIALPGTPIFGATKHWFPAYPFVALYAGLGFWRVVHIFRKGMGARLPQPRHTARALVAFMALLPPAIETVHSHPFGLSHYTFAAGGVPGAADYGMNRQFWGFTTGSLVDFFREAMPDGGRVFLCDTTPGAWDVLRRDGLIPSNIRGTLDLPDADYVMVHHELHFVEVDYQTWAEYGLTQPIHVLTYDGVPIITVYKNPR